MSTCQLLVKKPTVSKREIKIVLERNGYQRAKLESEDFDGRIVTLDVPEDDTNTFENVVGEYVRFSLYKGRFSRNMVVCNWMILLQKRHLLV
jgi:hypothetical protein